MPSVFSRMTFRQKMEWAKAEWMIRQTEAFDELRWRRREQAVGATANEAGRAIRTFVRIARPGER